MTNVGSTAGCENASSNIRMPPARRGRNGTFDIHRLVVSALVHGDDLHLYYNMASFLLKGYSLEFDLGSQAYATLLAFSLVTSQTLLFLSSWALMVLGYDGAMNTCTVGFSGVIFALKYVLARRSPGVTEVRWTWAASRWLQTLFVRVGVGVGVRTKVWLGAFRCRLLCACRVTSSGQASPSWCNQERQLLSRPRVM